MVRKGEGKQGDSLGTRLEQLVGDLVSRLGGVVGVPYQHQSEGIGAKEECVEGNGPVKGATMDFKKHFLRTALW